jgi:hypothetical protein
MTLTAILPLDGTGTGGSRCGRGLPRQLDAFWNVSLEVQPEGTASGQGLDFSRKFLRKGRISLLDAA